MASMPRSPQIRTWPSRVSEYALPRRCQMISFMSGSEPSAVERCDVCIVGARIAGLNALFVAGQHLSGAQKVILVDRRERVGGMGADTYPYERLHQPHPMFTAGNIKGTPGITPANR